jgi:hypothetical protein
MSQSPRAPLVPDHVARSHPVVTRDYSLYTNSIEEMGDTVARWLDDQVEGAALYGPSRFGKSSALNNWLQSMLAERYGGYIPLVIWSHSDSGGAQSVGRFYANLLIAMQHPLAKAARSPQSRLNMIMERFVELASQAGGRFVVLAIDESQGMTQREWIWLVEIHSLLERERVRMCVLSIASLQFFEQPINMALAGGAHVAARFMLTSAPFHGIRSFEELEFVLSAYDSGSEWPRGSGISFTAGVASAEWAHGFRMKNCAAGLWQALVDELPLDYDGPNEFPMKTIATASRHLLLRIGSGVDPDEITEPKSLREIVAATGHKTLMAIVSAGAPRRK